MSSITLYRKYRPQTFSEVIGQEHIVRTLSNSIAHDRIGHAYLFTGPRGTGKTTFARIFARAVNCKNPAKSENVPADACLSCDNCKHIDEGKSFDIFEIDAASNTGVENIRELRETVKLPPTFLKYKVYIIDEVHMLSTGAFNALLKTLEEPPAHVIFILATTEIHKVPETIVSRCQRFDFSRLSIEHIIEKLSHIAQAEKISIEKEALEMIAIAAEGGMRDAESLLSQVITLEDKNITASEVEEILGTTKRKFLEDMAGHLVANDIASALELISRLVADGYDLAVFHKSFLNYLRQLLLLSVDSRLEKSFSRELTSEQLAILKKQASLKNPAQIVQIISCFIEIGSKIRSSFIPQLPLEMAVIKALSKEDETPQKTAFHGSDSSRQPNAKKQEKLPNKAQKEASFDNSNIEKKAAIESKIEPQIVPEKQNIIEKAALEPELHVQKMPENSDFSMNDVRSKWGLLLSELRTINLSLATLFPHCKPVSLDGNTLTLGTRFSFYKDKLEETSNKLTMEGVFAKILGSPVKIRAIVDEETKGQSESITSIPDRDPSVIRETSPLLSDAMGIMGGQIVE